MKRLIICVIVIVIAMSFNLSVFAGENMLINPGFETGDTTGWSGGVDTGQAGYWVWDHDQHSGNYTAASGSWTPEPTPIIISQEVTVNEGDEVTFSGWTSGQYDFAPDSTACLKVEFLDRYGNVISTSKSTPRSGTYPYVKDTVQAVAPAETDRVRCIFYVESTGGSATFDDAELIIE